MLTTATMRLLGGRPCLDLVNTVEVRRDGWGPDLLVRYDDLLVWSERLALLDPAEVAEARAVAEHAPRDAAAILERTRILREAVATVFGAVIDGSPLPAAAAASLAAEIDAARAHQTLGLGSGRLTWVWRDEPPLARVLHRVALDAADLVTSASLSGRVKLCTGPNCGWLFLDETRNGSRRWCREAGCGAHVRMRRYRARN